MFINQLTNRHDKSREAFNASHQFNMSKNAFLGVFVHVRTQFSPKIFKFINYKEKLPIVSLWVQKNLPSKNAYIYNKV